MARKKGKSENPSLVPLSDERESSKELEARSASEVLQEHGAFESRGELEERGEPAALANPKGLGGHRPGAANSPAGQRGQGKKGALNALGSLRGPGSKTPVEWGNSDLPRVVIVGGGFAGLEAAKKLARAPVQIALVDRRNYHLFQPLLYQVATAGLNASDIAAPIRKVLRSQQNVEVLLAEAEGVDLDNRQLILSDGILPYDFLVLATGATHSYFGNDQWEKYAPGLKTMEDAFEIRRRVLFAFEAAERESDPKKQQEWLTFVVIGGGPTGVELAGALREIGMYTLVRDFRHIDSSRARVLLLEGRERVLPSYPEKLSEKAKKQLETLGVEVRTDTLATEIDDSGVYLGDEHIAAKTVLWGAGVAASPLGKSLGVPLDRAGRVLVERDLSVPGHPNIFVVGDLASFTQDGKPVFGVAPSALQAGRSVAANIQRALDGKPCKPFHYRDKGSLSTIGRARAVADVAGLKLWGFLAWAAWLAVHIFFLIGFRNRWRVLADWAWSYFTFERGARLITGQVPTLQEGATRAAGAMSDEAEESGAPRSPASSEAEDSNEDSSEDGVGERPQSVFLDGARDEEAGVEPGKERQAHRTVEKSPPTPAEAHFTPRARSEELSQDEPKGPG